MKPARPSIDVQKNAASLAFPSRLACTFFTSTSLPLASSYRGDSGNIGYMARVIKTKIS